jgi:hypothetical protein
MSPQSFDFTLLLVGAGVAALLITLVALVIRNLRRRRKDPQQAQVAAAVGLVTARPIVGEESLLAAIAEAEAERNSGRLAGLYLSLAQLRIDASDTRAAGDLLRKSIQTAAGAGLNEAHAKSRVMLGDLAQSTGDPVTACEHWQIARKLFHDIGRRADYNEVDARMLRNGCPTDWVLTDF